MYISYFTVVPRSTSRRSSLPSFPRALWGDGPSYSYAWQLWDSRAGMSLGGALTPHLVQ